MKIANFKETDKQLDDEMGRTSWEFSCLNLYDMERMCRRQNNHKGDCASGFGKGRIRWDGGRR